MMGLQLVAILVVLFPIDRLEDVGLAGVAPPAAVAAARLIGRTRSARERRAEART
jgi:hypothetical protein